MADPIQEVLQAFAHGELVVVTDDDDREGEGDLIVAASLCTAEKMAFIIRHTSGIVCAPITTEDARRLRPMNAPPAAGRWPIRTPAPTISRGPATCFR
jgi:3,4-dihydroxy 2-butanone 4-phosphate synthase/GTP cyclohydrolase II